MIRIKQYRSVIRVPACQRRIVESLGLKRIGHVRTVQDNVCIRGMISKVGHIVEILDQEGA